MDTMVNCKAEIKSVAQKKKASIQSLLKYQTTKKLRQIQKKNEGTERNLSAKSDDNYRIRIGFAVE